MRPLAQAPTAPYHQGNVSHHTFRSTQGAIPDLFLRFSLGSSERIALLLQAVTARAHKNVTPWPQACSSLIQCGKHRAPNARNAASTCPPACGDLHTRQKKQPFAGNTKYETRRNKLLTSNAPVDLILQFAHTLRHEAIAASRLACHHSRGSGVQGHEKVPLASACSRAEPCARLSARPCVRRFRHRGRAWGGAACGLLLAQWTVWGSVQRPQ